MDSVFRVSDFSVLKRILIVIGVLSGVLAFLILFSEPFSMLFSRLVGVSVYESGVSIALLIMSATSFSLVYLQSGGARIETSHSVANLNNMSPVRVKRLLDEIEVQRAGVDEKLDILNKKIEDAQTATVLTELEREKVVNGAIELAGSNAIKELFEREASRFEGDLKHSLGLERLKSSSMGSVERLKREIFDLRLRSNVNLMIGMGITAGGLWLLWSTVSMVDASELLKTLASEGQESDSKFLKNLILPIIPRILLVVFIEVFAYFFLRLYRNGLSEIKYFQNELTNVESKLTAIEFAYVTENDDALKSAIEALSKTERNFILEKGQTTVELEKAKSESELTRNIVKTIPKIFERGNK